MFFAVTDEERTFCPYILRMSMWSQFAMVLNSIEPLWYGFFEIDDGTNGETDCSHARSSANTARVVINVLGF